MKAICMRRGMGASACLAAVCLTAWFAPGLVAAQPGDDDFTNPQPAGPPNLQREIERIRTMLLPQQKEAARELIQKYPGTDVARIAQDLLDEYARYDQVAAQERQSAEAQKQSLRAYWAAQRFQDTEMDLPLVRITNSADFPVLFQVKGPGMGWAAPLRVSAGESITYNYPVLLRTFGPQGVRVYQLAAGSDYVFVGQQGPGTLRLFTAPPPRQ